MNISHFATIWEDVESQAKVLSCERQAKVDNFMEKFKSIDSDWVEVRMDEGFEELELELEKEVYDLLVSYAEDLGVTISEAVSIILEKEIEKLNELH